MHVCACVRLVVSNRTNKTMMMKPFANDEKFCDSDATSGEKERFSVIKSVQAKNETFFANER
jgi:hypothetical protein